MRKPFIALLAADEAESKARQEHHTAVRKAYPVGTIVHWKHGKQVRSAEVLHHVNCWWVAPEIRVRSTVSDKTYDISAWSVMEYERERTKPTRTGA